MNSRSLPLILCLALLAGCASKPQLPPIRVGSPISLTVVASPQTGGNASLRDSTIGENVSTGAGTGAVAGALAGLTCGPFFLICAPLGALMGSGVGVVAGAAVGAVASLPEETADQLRDRLVRLRQSHDPLAALRTHLTDRAGKHWRLTPEPADAAVNVDLQNLFLTSSRDRRIGLVMQVLVSVRGNGVPATEPPRQKSYQYVGPVSSLAVWLDEQNDFAQTSLHSASQQIALQIIADLAPN